MSSSEIYAATVAEKKMLVLRSFEGELFQVEEKVAAESQTIRALIEDDCADSVIPLPNVTAPILAKVIVYCKYHLAVKEKEQVKVVDNVADNFVYNVADNFVYNVADNVVDSDLKKFDEEFVKVDQDTLFDLLLAANYLNIQSLFDLTCQTVADMIKGKTPEQIRTTFNIKNDYTPEEEERVRRENAWAFQL